MTATGRESETSAPSPERIADLVQSLAAVMRQSELTELDLALGSVTVRLRRSNQDVVNSGPLPASTPAEAPANTSPIPHVITAPMIGTFYTSSTPGAAPFVSEGDSVSAGQTIGIIEAMKIMNEIAADRPGVVEKIIVANGQPVEYGSPLMRLTLAYGERP